MACQLWTDWQGSAFVWITHYAFKMQMAVNIITTRRRSWTFLIQTAASAGDYLGNSNVGFHEDFISSKRPDYLRMWCVYGPVPARISLLSYSLHAERERKKGASSSSAQQKPKLASVNSKQLWRRDAQKAGKRFEPSACHTGNSSRLIICCCTCSSPILTPHPPFTTSQGLLAH